MRLPDFPTNAESVKSESVKSEEDKRQQWPCQAYPRPVFGEGKFDNVLGYPLLASRFLIMSGFQYRGQHSLPPMVVHSNHSSHGTLSGFPEEDLRVGGKRNVGYFPAWLGQTFLGGKYVVVRKLGWGQYSSVWLARDKEFVIGITTCTVHARSDLS
jgi:hypothetical protein